MESETIKDNGGRRSLFDRRKSPPSRPVLEKRSGKDRRSGFDRRSARQSKIKVGTERRCALKS